MFISLYKHGLLDCTNIVIVSDHGKLETAFWIKSGSCQACNFSINASTWTRRSTSRECRSRTGLSGESIWLTQVSCAGFDVPLTALVVAKSKEFVMDKFQCVDNEQFRVYDRQRTPKRYHYTSSSRVGDVILDGRPGTIFFSFVTTWFRMFKIEL